MTENLFIREAMVESEIICNKVLVVIHKVIQYYLKVDLYRLYITNSRYLK